MIVVTRADVSYITWLHRKTPRIPFTDEWKQLLTEVLARHGFSRKAASKAIGLDANGTALGYLMPTEGESKLDRIRVDIIEKAAQHVGRELEVYARLDELLPNGKDDWGPGGERHCQLCGTWFHPHYIAGLCEECWCIQEYEMGEPRDVRYSKHRIKKVPHQRRTYEWVR